MSHKLIRPRGFMKTVISQFYSLFREAMFENKLTASDISAAKGVHYTYVYNSIRNNANLTLQTADDMAKAAGYQMHVTFQPIDASRKTLTGTMDPKGALYTERRTKPKPAVEAVLVTAEKPADPAAALDAEIEALLADA